MTASFKVAEPPWPSQFNASFPITRPTHFFGKVKRKKNSRITCKEASTLIYKHTILSLILTPIVLNYHRYFVFVAFLDI